MTMPESEAVAVGLPIHMIHDDDTGSCLHFTLAEADVCTACRQPEKTADQLRAERERLTDQLYSADPTDQVDAYLTLQGLEDAESQPPGCGWLPGDSTTECDWDPNCPVHGSKPG
jgi:hypothetical protein